ncbi:hypothetical protein PILCRDRAFT_16257 [Piloderma croceum F 1598]|uniref:Uncharacterized protein n=1 Tax=Piloderma croceum (strain F 1598) TaxID=765440 RepID=A0A0C3B4T8_PILCF|nr:hypothetical protein PILCRDRAFT_16257 [Piloderma croceum F 1598]
MDTSSPIRPARKRTRGPDEDNSNFEEDLNNSVAPGVAEQPPSPSTAAIDPLLLLENQNLTTYARHCAAKKKLRPEQVTELDSFVGEMPLHHQIRLFAEMLSISNKLDKIVTATPEWTVSKGLQTNIDSYVVAVLLSSSLHAYKGETTTDHVLEILKKHRFDMPPGIENNCADWKKIVTAVQESFTARRATWKKTLKASVSAKTNIYDLAVSLTKKSNCTVTLELCTRVALMRAVIVSKGDSATYWDDVDNELVEIHKQAGSGADKKDRITRAFRALLRSDKETYGDAAFIESEVGSELQVMVDEHISNAS